MLEGKFDGLNELLDKVCVHTHVCECVCMCGGKKDRVSFLTILLTLFDCSSLNGATQIQEFPDLKGTTSLEIL